jgi:hypothetical protein
VTHWKEPLDPDRHRDYVSGYQDAGGWLITPTESDGWVYFVRVCDFTFAFANIDQMREVFDFFGRTVHPARREPFHTLEHYWQRWFERLPPGLTGGSKRSRVRRALGKALAHFETKSHAVRGAKPARAGASVDAVLVDSRVVIAGVLPAGADANLVLQKAQAFLQQNRNILLGSVLQRRGVSRSSRPGGAPAARRGAALRSATYLGSGKTTALARLCRAQNPDVVVFLNDLSRSQVRRLESVTECPVVLAPLALMKSITEDEQP